MLKKSSSLVIMLQVILSQLAFSKEELLEIAEKHKFSYLVQYCKAF